MSFINFENLSVSYDGHLALQDINLQIQEQEHTVILGPNGSGKSTLLKLCELSIYPLHKPNMRFEIFNKNNWSLMDLRKKLGVITNDLHFIISHTASFQSALDIIVSGLYGTFLLYGKPSKTDIDLAYKTSEDLDITDLLDKKISQLSTGSLRKVIIARSIINNPDALILDEPTSGLDMLAQQTLLDLISKLSKTKTILIVTHHLEEILPQTKKIVFIKNAKIIAQGQAKTMITQENINALFDIKTT